ncbi:MAG: D-Ala-D-Ala carboxypeptidase family metallohydrolase [Vampirovibrionales bacterium]
MAWPAPWLSLPFLPLPPHRMAWTRATRLAPHFVLGEFMAPNEALPDEWVLWNIWLLAQRLQALRDVWQRPITITSGYRSPQQNQRVGGHPLSYHLRGMAADITVSGWTPHQVQQALAHWQGGLGAYATFTHIDIGPKRRWGQ